MKEISINKVKVKAGEKADIKIPIAKLPTHTVIDLPIFIRSSPIEGPVVLISGGVMGQPVLVENRPGAGGTIAAAEVARAPADGHALFVGFNGPLATAPLLFSKLTYDPFKSFEPIIATVAQPHVLAVKTDAPGTVRDWIAQVRSRPGRLNYASVGNASASHLSMELLKAEAGLFIVHIPYGGGPAATQALRFFR